MELPVTLRYQYTPEYTYAVQFDIAPFEEPSDLYRLGWDRIFGDIVVSPVGEFRGFSSENQLVLQENVMPGHIVHDNLQGLVAGQIGLIYDNGKVPLLVMQWRRDGGDWEWYNADAVGWQTFRVNVREVFAHAVLLAQLNVLEPNRQQNFIQYQVPRNVQLSFQTFGNHMVDGFIIPEGSMQILNGPLTFYSYLCGVVFGMAADDFRPVNFRGILGNIHNIHQENDNGVDVNLPVPNQTIAGQIRGQLGLLGVDGDIIGQLGIYEQRQLVLLVIKWRAEGDLGWSFYMPRVHHWEAFRSSVSEIFAHCVLVAQF